MSHLPNDDFFLEKSKLYFHDEIAELEGKSCLTKGPRGYLHAVPLNSGVHPPSSQSPGRWSDPDPQCSENLNPPSKAKKRED